MRIAENAGVPDDVVSKEVERQRRQLLSKAKKEDAGKELKVERNSQPAEKDLKYDDAPSAAAEEGVIRLLYLEPSLIKNAQIDSSDFSSDALGHIFTVLKEKIESGAPINMNVLANDLSAGEISLLVRITDKPEKLSESRQAMSDYVERIRERKSLSEKVDLIALANKLKEKGKGYIK